MAPKKIAAKKASAAPTLSGQPTDDEKPLVSEQPESPSKEGLTADIETKDEVKSPASSSASSKRKLQQNMVNQLRTAKKRVQDGSDQEGDQEKVQLYERYMSLGRFDEEKNSLLEQWAKDKQCGWWKTYEESRGQSFKKADEGLEGWGSR